VITISSVAIFTAIQGYDKITHKIHKTHSIDFSKNPKRRQTVFKILRHLSYIEKKIGQIGQSYDVINIFFKGEATILDYKNLV
jgi:hypothetical protein